jgi:hypothetical protein
MTYIRIFDELQNKLNPLSFDLMQPFLNIYKSHQINDLFELRQQPHKQAVLYIRVKAKDAWFYRRSYIRIDSLNHEKSISLKTPYGQINDVYIIDDEDWMGDLHLRSNYITKVYWSKSQGLIRYDKKYSIY